jgi:hypothetical protein
MTAAAKRDALLHVGALERGRRLGVTLPAPSLRRLAVVWGGVLLALAVIVALVS